MIQLFICMLLAHVLGDFYLQTDSFCEEKQKKGFKSWQLYVHGLVVGLLSWILLWKWSLWPIAIVITISHIVIDGIKCRKGDTLKIFCLDQCAHLVIIYIVAAIVSRYVELADWVRNLTTVYLYIISALLLLTPANLLIKKVFEAYGIPSSKDTNRVGGLIGNLERLLAFVLIMTGNIEAVGFLVAAKSILRYRDKDTTKTEYVLAGTLMSFGIAVVVGMIFIKFATSKLA